MNITIGVSGFQHEDWVNQFFPDDLPEEWRFDYYTNEFNSILLEKRDRLFFSAETIKEMLNSAVENFVFVLEGDELMIQSSSIECNLIYVNFPGDKNVFEIAGAQIEQAEIKKQQNVSESVCILRVRSARAIQNGDIKQILMHVYTNYSEFDHVCLFFGLSMQSVEIISAAKIINDLL